MPCAHRDLIDQPRERQCAAERDARRRQLPLVVADVGGGRHHEQRVATGGERVGAEHLPRLGGVGGTEDER